MVIGDTSEREAVKTLNTRILPQNTIIFALTSKTTYRFRLVDPKSGLVEMLEGNTKYFSKGTRCHFFGATPALYSGVIREGWVVQGLSLAFSDFVGYPDRQEVVTSSVARFCDLPPR